MAWLPSKIDNKAGVICFYCGKAIKAGDPQVYWNGWDEFNPNRFKVIAMHPICAIKLGGQLRHDGQMEYNEIDLGNTPEDASAPPGCIVKGSPRGND